MIEFFFRCIDQARRLEDMAIDAIQAHIESIESTIIRLTKALDDLDKRLQAYQDRR